MSNFEIEDEHKAQDIYETYVSNYTSTLIFGTGEEEPIGKKYLFFIKYITLLINYLHLNSITQ
jgi:hypothetical protein